jgi:hypothetical protein
MEEDIEIELELEITDTFEYQQQPNIVNTPVSGTVMGGNHTPVATPISSPREQRQYSELTQRGRQKKYNKSKKQGKKKGQDPNCKPWQLCWLNEHPYDPFSDVQNIYYNFDKACQHALGPLDVHGPYGACDPSTPAFALPPPQGF